MTPDERSLLQNFLQDLVQTRGQGKDPEADGMIQNALRSSPDAAYVLVQHAVMSDQALHAAQAQIADLQSQLSAASAPRSGFLPQTGPAPSPWSQPSQSAPQPAPQASSYYGPGPFSGGGGLGSFLRSAGTTAAGVAGGALLFEGLSGLFGGHGGGFGGFGGGGWGGGGGYGGTTVETVTNNYYDDDNSGGGGGGDWGGDSGGGGWDDSGSNDS